jgi:hypothetical protein
MRPVWNVLRVILSLCDVLVMVCSPLFIILIVVCVIVLLDRGGAHWRFVNKLEQKGLVAQAVVADDEPSAALGWMVEFDDPAQPDERYGWVDPAYYSPEVAATLKPGAEIEIRYLPQSYESDVVLNRHFDQVKGYWGYATDVGIAFIVSWLVLIWHPEFLYLGYDVPFDQALKTTFGTAQNARRPR